MKCAPDCGVRRVAKLLHPSGSKEKIVLVLKAYLDASGTDPRQGVAVVAGFAASEARWDRFEQAWNALLKELGLKRWHNTDFHNRVGEYLRWREAQFLYAAAQAWKIISIVQPIGIGAAIKRSDWRDLRPLENPLRFCIDYCLAALIHRLHETPIDDGVAIFVDRDENENLAREITDWHIDYYRHNSEVEDKTRDITLAFGSDRQFVPIQAADILANETYRYMTGGGDAPFMGAIPIGSSDTHARPFIEAIKEYSFLSVQLFSKSMLKVTIDAIARGEMRPDGRNPDAVFRQIILEDL